MWGLDVSADGAFVLSAGQDRSLRVWARGDDLVFVEEEKERAMEHAVDRAAAVGSANSAGTGAGAGAGAGGVGGIGVGVWVSDGVVGSVEGDASAAAGASSLASIDSVRGGEMLMDALDLVQAELALQAERTAVAR